VTIVVVMGVSGAGKTTVGEALAARLGWAFVEGDALHPAANVAKMAAGEPLTDADRAPWLAAIARRIDELSAGGAVVTCSALKRAYRSVLARPGVRFVFLTGEPEVLEKRMAARRGHFMPPSLLASQLATLEPPGPSENAVAVDIGADVNEQVEAIVTALGLAHPPGGAGR